MRAVGDSIQIHMHSMNCFGAGACNNQWERNHLEKAETNPCGHNNGENVYSRLSALNEQNKGITRADA